jgi:YdcK Beta solenoid repeat
MTHYKLTEETIVNADGITLYCIELTEDCKYGKAGTKGGYIEKESNLSGDAWVSGNARVYGNAQVYGDAWVSGNAQVYGDA